MAEFVNQSVQLEQSSKVQHQHNDDAGVERPHGRAVVIQLFSVQVGQSLALAVDTWHEHVECHLREAKEPVDLPRLVVGIRLRLDQVPHVAEEVGPALALDGRGELSIVESGSDPHVVHECRKHYHHGAHAECAAEFRNAGRVLWRKVLLRLDLVVEGDGLGGIPVCVAVALHIDRAHIARPERLGEVLWLWR